jgi:hypothetical protein
MRCPRLSDRDAISLSAAAVDMELTEQSKSSSVYSFLCHAGL